MRSRHWVLAISIACGCGLGAGCSIDRSPPRVVQVSEGVQSDGARPAEDDHDAERFAGYAEAVSRDGGIVLGAHVQAGSGAVPPEDTDADGGAGCEPGAH